MEKLIERSQVSSKSAIVVGLAISLFLGMVSLTLYIWFTRHFLNPFELFVELLFLFVLIERAGGKYTYELDKRVIRLTKRSLFGTERQFEVPYKEVIGIYRYKAKLIGVIKFRRTYRLQSALDGRAVWTIAYKVAGRKGRMENQRIYFKPSEGMLLALKERIPGRVMISEEEVVTREVTDETEQEKQQNVEKS